MSERTYIVTLHDRRDLENFYDEMEFPGSGGYIPTRSVKCRVRRNLSRNTHYNLTPEEAEILRKDPRVLAVELPPEDRGITIRKYGSYTLSGQFNKSNSGNTGLNWGHLHCAGTAIQRRKSNWGSGLNNPVTDSVEVWQDGKDVDIVIVDGGVIPGHPEWNSDPDGVSGVDRFVQYQWFNELNSYVNAIDNDLQTEPTGTIPYTDADFHGMHVAGTAAGSLRGWANQANIYNLNIFPDNPAIDIPTLLIFDYLRAFHRYKPINPITGRRNPTVTNHSWGYGAEMLFDESQGIYDIQNIYYRGTTYTAASPGASGWTGAGINTDFGIHVENGIATIPFRVAGLDADIQDAINDGIIIIAAAGNEYTYADNPLGQDYNNRVNYDFYNESRTTLIGNYTDYYMRGSSPGAATSVVCVGSLDNNEDFRRSSFSNYGPRIDIFAPGAGIVSAFDDASWVAEGYTTQNINDPRDTNFDLGVIRGTSMASPQVAGIIACHSTNRDRVSLSEVRKYLKSNAVLNDMTGNLNGGGYADGTSLSNTYNAYITAKNVRSTSGLYAFNTTYNERPVSGQAFPRVRAFQQVDCSKYLFYLKDNAEVPGDGLSIKGRDDYNYYGGEIVYNLYLSSQRSLSLLYEESNPIDVYYYHATASSTTSVPFIIGSSQSFGTQLDWNSLVNGKYIINDSVIMQVGNVEHYPWTVVNSGSSNYILSGYDRIINITGSPTSNYTINVNVGDIVSFNVNATGHPFYIKTTPSVGTGDLVTTGDVVGQGTQVGEVSWNTVGVTPGTYYYICQFHSAMQGQIVVRAYGT